MCFKYLNLGSVLKSQWQYLWYDCRECIFNIVVKLLYAHVLTLIEIL